MNLDGHEILAGDCVEGMKGIPDGSVDLAFADPPFNIGYGYDIYEDRKSAEDYIEWCRSWGREVVRVLKPDGSFWLAIGDEFAAELKVLFHRDLGLHPRNWVVWHYTFGVNCTKKFSRTHAHLLYFTKHPSRFTFDADAVRVPSARQRKYNDARANASGKVPADTWVLDPSDSDRHFDPESDSWCEPRVCGTFRERAGFHGCQMPERVVARAISACSREGDLVLSPFGGSGTALAVAKKLGRRCVGFELSRTYADGIRSRLNSIDVGDPIGRAVPR